MVVHYCLCHQSNFLLAVREWRADETLAEAGVSAKAGVGPEAVADGKLFFFNEKRLCLV